MELKPLREEIDRIDQDLVRLLDRRAEIAEQVGLSKANTGAKTFDPGRAKAVVLQAVKRSSGAFPREGLVYVFREVLSACLNLQKSLRVGFLGPRATFTHQAAIREFGSSVEFTPFRTTREIFQAVEAGSIDYGVVPVENSTGGIVHDTLDCFIESTASICSEILLPIRQSLMANCELSEIKTVYSHPQGLLQCARWLEEHLPNAQQIPADSTAQGLVQAKDEPNAAAIGSDLAAEQYGLQVLARGIEDTHENTTRFLVIATNDSKTCGDDKTSIMFGVHDKPGALFSVLKPFNDLGINLSKIESRPTKKKAWEQAFFVDAHGHRDEARMVQVIEELKKVCQSVRILGSYPREKTPKEVDQLQNNSDSVAK
ncbi:prephenate dehydratase [soil metagenome]